MSNFNRWKKYKYKYQGLFHILEWLLKNVIDIYYWIKNWHIYIYTFKFTFSEECTYLYVYSSLYYDPYYWMYLLIKTNRF